MIKFLILALPRSRTAWLANFMTNQGLFCYHEAINGCRSMSEYLEKTDGCGDSDTALALFNDIPQVPTVIIDSSIERAVEFGLKNGHNITNAMEIEKERLDGLDGLHININDIDDRLEEIWNHLTEKEYNRERAEMLKKFDIQIKDVADMDVDAMAEFMRVTDGLL